MNHAYHRNNRTKIWLRRAKYYAMNPDKKERASQVSRASTYRKWRESSDVTPPKFGLCPICLVEKKLVFDHDHETKKQRGWLCNNCNRGLGYFKDNSDGLIRAANYLILFELDQLGGDPALGPMAPVQPEVLKGRDV